MWKNRLAEGRERGVRGGESTAENTTQKELACWGDGAGALTPSQSVRNTCMLQSQTETLITPFIKSSFHSF